MRNNNGELIHQGEKWLHDRKQDPLGSKIMYYLAWFARTHMNQSYMGQAISKWNSDSMYILSYIPGSFKIRAREVYVRKIEYLKS